MKADLSRFTAAHESHYVQALREIENGRKTSHWMWYIFPQIAGLGSSSTAAYYAIRDLEEAKAFLADAYLGGNLREICRALLKLEENNPSRIFGWPDDLKLRSSMTLFSCAGDGESLFDDVLDKFYGGEKDELTLNLL